MLKEKFKLFMRNVPQPVFISIAKSIGNKLAGLTVSSFESISIEPIITLVSIDKLSQSLEVFKNSIGWTVSLLNENQQDISNFFANSSISQEERFSRVYPLSRLLKIPYIENSIGYVECIYYKHIPMGDHIIFFGKVINVEVLTEDKPIVYYNRSYRKLA